MWRPIILLCISNVFMTYAWYGHLKDFKNKAMWVAILVSWSVAFFEYCFQVPANRYGAEVMTLPQLKITQEVITMVIFTLFSVFYMHKPVSINLLWAGLCLLGAVFFIFKS